MIADSLEAKKLFKSLGSAPVHVDGDRFRAKPRRDIPEDEKPTPAMRKAQTANIKKAQAAVRKRRKAAVNMIRKLRGRLSPLFAQEEPEDRQAAQPRHLRTRARRPRSTSARSSISSGTDTMAPRLQLFAFAATAGLGRAVAEALHMPIAAHEERGFEDGEHKVRPLDDVAGNDVYVVQSTHGGPGRERQRQADAARFFIGALKDAGAARITAVVPYLAYARKDRRTKPNDPVTTRYVAQMLESVGADCVVTLEVHNPAAFENAFRCRAVALTTTPLFIDYAKAHLAGEDLAVISPDAGGMKRAELLREALEAASANRSARDWRRNTAAPGSCPAICSSAMLAAVPR